MIEANHFYVYIWRIKETGEVFYVGKGCKDRYKSMKNRNAYFKNIRKKYDCECEIVKYFDDEEKAYDFELELGKYYKSIGQAKASKVLGNINRYFDYETLSKIKKTSFKKNSKPWNKGKKMNDEYRKKCRDRVLGTKQSEETKKKRSEALMGHEVSKSTREAISNSKKKKCAKVNIDNMEIIKIYDSMTDCAKDLNVSASIITLKCKQFPKEYKGFYWRYI